jgi:hypothetical protein
MPKSRIERQIFVFEPDGHFEPVANASEPARNSSHPLLGGARRG